MSDQPTCSLCGEPMPAGEEMFKYHGYSGSCPKPPLTPAPQANLPDDELRRLWRSVQGPLAELNGPLIRYGGLVYAAAKEQAESQASTLRQERDAALDAWAAMNERRSTLDEDATQWRREEAKERARADKAEAECTALRAALEQYDAYMAEQFREGPSSPALHPKAAENWRRVRAALASAPVSRSGAQTEA